MSKIQVLITGASGFIGQNFIRAYSQDFDIRTVSLRHIDAGQVDFKGIHTVLHLAALVHQMSGAPKDHYFEVNTILTEKMAITAKQQGIKHFVYMSSAHVYGRYGNLENLKETLSEKTICQPIDPYGQSKLQAEIKLQALQDANFKVSIIRSPLVYGPGGKGNLNSLKKLIQVLPALPFRFLENRRSVIYVDNLCYFISLIISQAKPGIFLPQDQNPLSIVELVGFIAKAIDKKIILFHWPGILFRLLCKLKPSIMQRLYGSLALDSTISNAELGYVPLVSTEVGIGRTFGMARSSS